MQRERVGAGIEATSPTTAEPAGYPSLPLCASRAVWLIRRRKLQEERRNEIRRRKMDTPSAIAWTFLVVFNIIVTLNASWAKDRLPTWKRNGSQKNQKDRRAPPFSKKTRRLYYCPCPSIQRSCSSSK